MDSLIQEVSDFAGRQLLDLALRHFYVFLLVVIRLAGLMSTGPVFGQKSVPINVRVFIVLGMAFVLTPVLQQTSTLDVARFDTNQDGRLSSNEAPTHMHGRLRRVAESTDFDPQKGVPIGAFAGHSAPPEHLPALVRDVFAEFSLGFLLGLGVLVLLSGLQLAGQLIDQQLGLEFGAIFNPDMGAGASVSTQILFLLGTTILLLMEPINGHVLLLGALIETFDAMPVGEAVLFSGTPFLFTELVHKSLLLGVQVAAPVMTAMALVTVSMGFLGHSVPQINQLVVGFPIRSLAGICIFSLTLTGIGDVIVAEVPTAITEIQLALTSYQ